MAAADRVRELQEHPRVALHGAADVAQQNDRTLPPAAHAAWQRYNVAARAEALAQGAPDVEAWPAAAHPPARAAFARFPGQPRSAARAIAVSSAVYSAKSLLASPAAALQVG